MTRKSYNLVNRYTTLSFIVFYMQIHHWTLTIHPNRKTVDHQNPQQKSRKIKRKRRRSYLSVRVDEANANVGTVTRRETLHCFCFCFEATRERERELMVWLQEIQQEKSGVCVVWGIEKQTPIMTKRLTHRGLRWGWVFCNSYPAHPSTQDLVYISTYQILNLLVGKNSVRVSSHSYHELFPLVILRVSFNILQRVYTTS